MNNESPEDQALRKLRLRNPCSTSSEIGVPLPPKNPIACGKTTCRCYHDPDARHGPYHYWTRKARGKTVGMRLTEDELVLYQEWIENNRELERIVREMRGLSSRVLALITGREAP